MSVSEVNYLFSWLAIGKPLAMLGQTYHWLEKEEEGESEECELAMSLKLPRGLYLCPMGSPHRFTGYRRGFYL